MAKKREDEETIDFTINPAKVPDIGLITRIRRDRARPVWRRFLLRKPAEVYIDDIDYQVRRGIKEKTTPFEWVRRKALVECDIPKSLLNKGLVDVRGKLMSKKEIKDCLKTEKGDKILFYKAASQKPVDYFRIEDIAKTFRRLRCEYEKQRKR